MVDKMPMEMIMVVVGCLKQDTKISRGAITDSDTDLTAMVSLRELNYLVESSYIS